jgi:hypothetical protein
MGGEWKRRRVDPKAITDTSLVAFDAFRRDYLVASVVVLLVINGCWAWAMRAVLKSLASVQEARVADQKEAKQELALHLDKNTDAVTMLLMDARKRAKARRSTDAPATDPGIKKLPEGP